MRYVKQTMAAVALAGLMAAPAVAQAGEAGERSRRGGFDMQRAPFARILEHREALGLSADQVRRIETVQTRVQSENAPRIERLRALMGERRQLTDEQRREMRERFQQMTEEERQQARAEMRERMEQRRAAMMERRIELEPIHREIRETSRAAMQEVREILTPEQREQLRALSPRGQDGPGMRGERRRDGDREGRRGRRPARSGGV